ncbi:MAG: ribonuclease D [Gammaproteobacteria bacterium]
MPTMTDAQLIDDADALQAFVESSLGAPLLGLDTEFVRDRHYFPRAGLIQIATPERIALVDPVRIEDLAPLAPLLFETPAVKILHAAHQDLELLLYLFGRVPAPLFDTQTAAEAVGLAAQIGHATLVEALLHAAPRASLGRYDWLRRPLAAEALDYAADDVVYLGELYEQLGAGLVASKKEAAFADAMRKAADPARYRPDPDNAWRRMRAARRLNGDVLARLKPLAAWRERQAMDEDRPRQWVLRDEVLLALARQAPRSFAELGRIEPLTPAARRRYGEQLLGLIEAAETQSESESASDAGADDSGGAGTSS